MAAELSICRSCGAKIYWVRTVNNAKMPINAEPSETGNIYFVETIAHYTRAGVVLPPGTRRWVSHHATCPQAAQHRRRKAKP